MQPSKTLKSMPNAGTANAGTPSADTEPAAEELENHRNIITELQRKHRCPTKKHMMMCCVTGPNDEHVHLTAGQIALWALFVVSNSF